MKQEEIEARARELYSDWQNNQAMKLSTFESYIGFASKVAAEVAADAVRDERSRIYKEFHAIDQTGLRDYVFAQRICSWFDKQFADEIAEGNK